MTCKGSAIANGPSWVDSASANTPFTILIFYLKKSSQESILLLLIVYIHVYVEYNIYLK